VNSLSKAYIVPGYRAGWIIVYNRQNYLDKVLLGLGKFNQILYPPASIIQFALPRILSEVPPSFFEELCGKIAQTAYHLYD
jgi:tyrosine aminotransferase